MLIEELLWTGHPLGRDVAGTRKTVSAISREMILGYRKLFYQPANTVVAIAGNVTHQQALSAVGKLMGNWHREFTQKPAAAEFTMNRNQCIKIERRDTAEANLCLALPGLSLFDPRRFAMDILSIVLGGGMSSRLFTEVRDRLGLVYSIHAFSEHVLDSGSLIVTAGVEPKNLHVVISAILKQLAGMKAVVPAAELAKAKEIAKGPLLMQMENSRTTAGWVAAQELLANRILTVDKVIQLIDAVTAEDVQQLAKEYLLSERLKLAVVGPVPPDEPLVSLLHID
jgi:predicted Zn-dependent peptidase